MRLLAGLSVVVAACSPSEPDEIEVRVSIGSIDRDQLSRVIVLVDPPTSFDRMPGGDEVAPGVNFEFLPAGESNRLLVTFTPPPTATSLDQDLVFTVELHGGFGETGSVRAIGYDLTGQAIAGVERLDVPFGGFEEVTLALDCLEAGCAPVPKLGGYPVTLDFAATDPPQLKGLGALVLASSASAATPVNQILYLFGDPDFDNGRGRIAVLDGSRASELTSFDLPPTMLPCMITGDAPGDRFGASAIFGSDMPGVPGEMLAVGAPGANGGVGAVYVLSMAGPDCPHTSIGANANLVVRLEAANTTAFGHSLAVIDTDEVPPDGSTRLAIGELAPANGSVYVVFDLTGATGARTLDATNSARIVAPTGFREFGRTLAIARSPASLDAVAIGTDNGFVFVVTVFLHVAGNIDASTDALVLMMGAPTSALLYLPGTSLGEKVLAIGAPEATDSNFAKTGVVFITRFSDVRGNRGLGCTDDTCIFGVQEGDELGATLAVGSFRNAGDLVVGAPGARREDTETQTGAVYVLAAETLESPLPDYRPVPVFGRDMDDPSLRLLYRLYGTETTRGFGNSLLTTDMVFAIAGRGDGSDSLFVTQDFVPTWGP